MAKSAFTPLTIRPPTKAASGLLWSTHYLSKVGLPYEAVTYINTVAASNEMTWLNISDAAQRGIRVTLLSSLAKETMAVYRRGTAT